MRQATEAFGRILDCMLALFALGNMEHYFVLALYLTVACSMSACCRAESGALDPSGDDFSGCATPGSTAEHVVLQYTWLLDEFPTVSTSTWTRIMRCFSPFSRRMEKCAQSMPQVMAHACAASTWKSSVSASLTWAALGMMIGRG